MKKLTFLVYFIFLFSFEWLHGHDLPENLKTHVRILASDSLQGRGLGTQGTLLAKDYIIEQFKDVGIAPLDGVYEQAFSFRSGAAWIAATNIVGVIQGSDPNLSNEYIVIGAHYDHLGYDKKNGEKTIFPGADDNASGVAAIIEIGRYFAQNPELLGRSLLVVAFDAEESGLHGSRYFVEHAPVVLSDIKLMFSFDMVGMYETNGGVHLNGLGSLIGGRELVKEIATNTETNIRGTVREISQNTDTAPFGDKGIPAIHVFTGTKSPYHKPEDQFHLLDYEGMAIIVRFKKELLFELSQEPELVPVPSLETRPAVRTGLSATTFGLILNNGRGFHRYQDEFFRANSIYNGAAGLYMQVPISNFFTLQQELLYDFNGSEALEGRFRRHSVTLPLNVQLGTPRSLMQEIRLYFFVGGYYRFNFAGNYAGESLNFEESYHQNEWGYSTGIGIELFQFHVGYTLRRGRTNILKSENSVILDSNAYFTLGYRF